MKKTYTVTVERWESLNIPSTYTVEAESEEEAIALYHTVEADGHQYDVDDSDTFSEIADRTVQTIICGQMASDWDIAIVAKQNWIQITREQIKSIPVGSPIRVGGTETILSYHYKAPTDYGFNTEHEIQKLEGGIFGSSDWNKNIKVEVLMNQGHPHAELMLQYAQDAMTTSEPWELWQVQDGDFGGPKGEWRNLEEYSNLWIIGKNYRRKPITKLIHGVAVPDISFNPEDNEYYFYPDPTMPCMYEMEYFHNYAEECGHRLTNKMCYPTTDEGREAAILHAKAMLGDQP